MYKDYEQLILYKNFDHTGLIGRVAGICRRLDADISDNGSVDDIKKDIYDCVHELLKVATDFNFDGNLWHALIAFSILTDENPYAVVCERSGGGDTSADTFAKRDMAHIYNIFCYDFTELESKVETDVFSIIGKFIARKKNPFLYNDDAGKCIHKLCEGLEACRSSDDFYNEVTVVYKKYGVGLAGLNRAFRLEGSPGHLSMIPVGNMDPVRLSDLVGYELQKEMLITNTENFLEGRKANNCLLYGDSGTGKSTSIKALVNEYYERGLRLIEVNRHQFELLSDLIALIRKRNYKFIIFLDDLSFEEHETEYKFLKAVIEGGVETRPDNILIYATSNRRHLVREVWDDRGDTEKVRDVHRSDSVEEKLSLYNRFGLTVNYIRPDRHEYYDIVRQLAVKANVIVSEEELLAQADRFALRHGGMSGRTAEQFVNSMGAKA